MEMPISNADAPSVTRQEFLDSVLRLSPQTAAFDCDGTLWTGDSGERFFDWEIRKGLVSDEIGRTMRARYLEYKSGQVSEDEMCAEMVTMHKGMAESILLDAAAEFMATSFSSTVFDEMLELVHLLHQKGCEIWAVSSSNEWVIRAGVKQFGINADRILAATAAVENGIITGRMVRLPSGPGKPQALREVAKKKIDAAFGNSRWDTEMLEYAAHGFAINPNPDLEATARERGWTIYFPALTPRR